MEIKFDSLEELDHFFRKFYSKVEVSGSDKVPPVIHIKEHKNDGQPPVIVTEKPVKTDNSVVTTTTINDEAPLRTEFASKVQGGHKATLSKILKDAGAKNLTEYLAKDPGNFQVMSDLLKTLQ